MKRHEIKPKLEQLNHYKLPLLKLVSTQSYFGLVLPYKTAGCSCSISPDIILWNHYQVPVSTQMMKELSGNYLVCKCTFLSVSAVRLKPSTLEENLLKYKVLNERWRNRVLIFYWKYIYYLFLRIHPDHNSPPSTPLCSFLSLLLTRSTLFLSPIWKQIGF